MNPHPKSHQAKPKAILIDVIDPTTTKEEAEKRLEELEMLTDTFGGMVVIKTIQKRGVPDYQTYIGKGKVEEIIQLGQENKAKLLILNNIAKPGQIYNLNEAFRKAKMEVWDRIDLILNIFDKHAQSTEAKLQIALARIRHMGPRIIGLGKELMQQMGVKGVRSGQGETNIELMKRHLAKQEQRILEKLAHYDKINEGHRQMRRRKNFKTAALIGYTNAGKSTVLKALTKKDVYIADELFATLETKVGKLYIPPKAENNPTNTPKKYQPGTEILLSDTIGFIQDLPPSLIKAFKSTLAETIDADLLLHVIDISDPQIEMKIEVVEEILTELGLAEKPKVYVFNKIDLIDYEGFMEADENSENPNEEILRPQGILKAGRQTARQLGWIDFKISPNNDDLEAFQIHNPKYLQKRFSPYSPVFVSAHRDMNMEDLVERIEKRLIK